MVPTLVGVLVVGVLVVGALVVGAEDVDGGKLSFIYPPRENKPTLVDGFSDEVWFEESMENKLSQKVERNNNLAVEIQGAVIFTKK